MVFEPLREGEKTAKISLFAVALLGFVKGIVGLTSASVSLLAQAVDAFTDLFALLAVILGMRISRHEASARFPYGYYRAETLASLLVSGLILVTGGGVLWESALRILHPQSISTPLWAVMVAMVSLPVLYALYRYVKTVGERIDSQSLQSQAFDFKMDSYTSLLVVFGIAANHFGHPWLEGVIGAAISLFILKTGLMQGWEAVLVLMDAVVNPDRLEQVKALAMRVKGVRSVSKVRLRKSGPFCFGVLTIGVDKRVPVDQAHRLTEAIETRVKQEYPSIESLLIHMEPQEDATRRIAIPIREDLGLNSSTTLHFGETPYFLFVDTKNGTIHGWMTKRNPGRELQRKRGITSAKLLAEEETTTLLTGRLGEGPYHYLRDVFIDIFELPEGITVTTALNAFLADELKPITEATTET